MSTALAALAALAALLDLGNNMSTEGSGMTVLRAFAALMSCTIWAFALAGIVVQSSAILYTLDVMSIISLLVLLGFTLESFKSGLLRGLTVFGTISRHLR